MKIYLIISIVILSLYSFGQGSGSALKFDGTNDDITMSNANLQVTTNFTVEGWIKPDFDSDTWNCIWEWESPIYTHIFFVNNTGAGDADANAQSIYVDFSFSNGADKTLCTPSGSIKTNEWNHIAVVRDGLSLLIYINGVSQTLSDAGWSSGSYTATTEIETTSSVSIGERGDNTYNFKGDIDEIRLWNEARTASQIKDNMCKTVSAPYPASLKGYWNINDGSGTILSDLASNSINGTLNDMAPLWVTSAAAIGDNSSYLYTGTWAGQTISLSSTNKGNIEINTVAGTPSGIHVYRVDGVPNSTTGITPNLGSNNVYYGTFIVGTASSYTVEYDYTNYPDAIDEEANLRLYYRDNNADDSWSDITGTVDNVSNTITKTSVVPRNEFVIGGTEFPLPIELLFFNVQLGDNNDVQVKWQTATETNNDYFTLQRSKNGVEWENINTIAGAGNSNMILNYVANDYKPYEGVSYYRLKQTDFDGQFSFSKIKSINNSDMENNQIIIYPNPTTDYITIIGNSIELEAVNVYDILRKNVSCSAIIKKINNKKIVIDLSELSGGIYYIRTKSTVNKVYKQ